MLILCKHSPRTKGQQMIVLGPNPDGLYVKVHWNITMPVHLNIVSDCFYATMISSNKGSFMTNNV